MIFCSSKNTYQWSIKPTLKGWQNVFEHKKDMHVLYKNDNDMCKSNSSGSSNKSEYLMLMFIYQQHYL